MPDRMLEDLRAIDQTPNCPACSGSDADAFIRTHGPALLARLEAQAATGAEGREG